MSSRAEAIPQRAYPTGMLIAIGAILMYFTALISAWVVRKGFAQPGMEVPVDLPRLLLEANAGTVIASSLAIEIARRRLRAADHRRFRAWWLAGAGLGVVFLAGQAAALGRLRTEGVFLASSPEASFFYLFAASHAIHLIGGIVGLGWAALRPLRHLAIETAARVGAMYWHFLTAVWLVLLVLLLGAAR